MKLTDLFQRYTSAEAGVLTSNDLLQLDRKDFARQPKDEGLDIIGFDFIVPELHYVQQSGLIQGAVQTNLETDEVTEDQPRLLENIDLTFVLG